MRKLQRKVEAAIGGKLLKLVSEDQLKKSKLILKQVRLPKMGIVMHYYERESSTGGNVKTILFCHGLSDQAKNFSGFITSLNIPDDVRILAPDAIGHGNDLERAKKDPNSFEQPTSSSILESTIEFLTVLKVKKCNAFGYSMGGALAYFLRFKRPDIVQRTVLVSPSLESCVDKVFIEDFLKGRKRHWCFEERNDAKLLFRDLSVPHRKVHNPIPKFFLEAIVRDQQTSAPRGHYREMLELLLKHIGTDTEMSTPLDIDPYSPRLVIWPRHDFICNYDQGKKFFECSDGITTNFHTIEDCGHMFHSDGRFILDIAKDQISDYLLQFQETTTTTTIVSC